MIRAIPIALLGACALTAGQVSAQQLQWQAFEYDDRNGRPMASVDYGIPQTDATLLSASCTAGEPGDIVMHLNVDPGPNQPGAQVELTIVVGNRNEIRNAAIIDGPEGRYTEAQLGRHDGLWEILMSGHAGTMAVWGGAWSDFHLQGSRAAISRFLATCDRFAAAAGGSPNVSTGGQALAGPLYLIAGNQATPMIADLQDPYTVEMLAPGTEVMSFNTQGPLNGRTWVQVATARGVGTTGWVEQTALVPTTGGAAEYQNLNQVANLVIRAQAASGGAIVGSVPPFATGIMDQGQIQGGWILVRYGNTIGWASHEYLMPILPGAAAGQPVGQPGPAEGYHEATYGSWRLECDPCRHPEDGATCQISSLTGPLAVHFYDGDDLRIGLLYGPPMELHEPEASTLTLRMVIDGQEIAALRTPQWQVWEMTGEIGIYTFGDMIVAMRTGQALTLSLEGPATQVADSFALTGFSEAQDDLLTRFPVENVHLTGSFCPNL